MEKIIFYSIPKPEACDREPAVAKIERPLQLAIGKCLLIIKRSLFIDFAHFGR